MSDRTHCDCDTDIEIDGVDYSVMFERITQYSTENWGADADGNRGERRTFIDGDWCERVFIENKKLEDYDIEFKKKAEQALEKWLDKHKPGYDN